MDQATFIKSVLELPSPSPVLNYINSVMENPQSSASDIAEVLRIDPVIAGKVLRLANSAYIGIPNSVSSLQNAVVLLGMKRIHSLIAVSEFLRRFQPKCGSVLTLETFWRHSITVALIAESMAKHLKRYDSVDEHDAFSGAILHDIGKLILACYYPDLHKSALEKSARNKIPLFKVEDDQVNHTRIGELLAQQWLFPSNLCAGISCHHCPGTADMHLLLVSIIHVADVMAHILGCPVSHDETAPSIEDVALKTIKLPPERLRVIAENVLNNRKKIESTVSMFSSNI